MKSNLLVTFLSTYSIMYCFLFLFSYSHAFNGLYRVFMEGMMSFHFRNVVPHDDIVEH